MLEKMTDLQFVLYVLSGISAVVLLQKIIVSLIYRHLKKETDGLPTVNDRWMKQLKLKYENTYKINSHMADTRLYVDRQVGEAEILSRPSGGDEFILPESAAHLYFAGRDKLCAGRPGRGAPWPIVTFFSSWAFWRRCFCSCWIVCRAMNAPKKL